MNIFRAFIYLILTCQFMIIACGDDEPSANSGELISSEDDENSNLGDEKKAEDLDDKSEDKESLRKGTEYSIDGQDFDLKDCRAQNYGANAKTELSLRDQIWCGDIENRFRFQKDISPYDYIYDALLKGYWSKKSADPFDYDSALKFCSDLGKGWTLPRIYYLLSLVSESKLPGDGYVNEIFDDNDKENYWSSRVSASVDTSQWYLSFEGGAWISYEDRNRSDFRVRCFRPEESSGKKSCDIKNGQGEQLIDENGIAGECMVKSCDEGSRITSDLKYCIKLPSYNIDLKSCKAPTYVFNVKPDLGLSDQVWCGDFTGRFTIKADAGPNEFVYDWILRGYWSKAGQAAGSWKDVNTYCSNLGEGWVLPDFYQMLSLVAEKEDEKLGFINPIFSDNIKDKFWTSTIRPGTNNYYWFIHYNFKSAAFAVATEKANVRCFKKTEF